MLPDKQAGGPKGLGDPEDKTLRKVELEVLIPMKMRDKTKKEKCVEEGQAFTECCKDAGFWMFIKCRPKTNALNKCISKWYNDEELKKQCTEEYLVERSEYRRTGISAKQRKKEAVMF